MTWITESPDLRFESSISNCIAEIFRAVHMVFAWIHYKKPRRTTINEDATAARSGNLDCAHRVGPVWKP